ncbi:penicillin acylase family protein [Methylocucumis oryzae]|uniref:penicillin acylase family protein n=1 Tax=Methylocucumis oryzae TaxID=1632867 RepID=UPI000698566D
MATEASQPLIFAEWLRQLLIEICEKPLGSAYDWLDDYNPAFIYNLFTQQNGSTARWCKASTSQQRPCHEEIKHALQSALANLQAHYGDNPADWYWQEAHITAFKHPLFNAIPLLNRWFTPQVGREGGMDTINVSGYRYDTDTGRYLSQSGSAFRAIYDLAKPDNSLYILPTGQSGQIWSSHYQDMLNLWTSGNYLPMHTQRETIEQETVQRTRLSPTRLTLTTPAPPISGQVYALGK